MTNPSSQSIDKFRVTVQDLWLLCKQAWYVPFVWSLAWFSYWIFHDAIVLGQITHGTPSDLCGISISISVLLFGGYATGKSMTRRVIDMLKKKFSYRKPFDKKTTENPQMLRSQTMASARAKTERPKPKVGEKELVEINPRPKSLRTLYGPKQLSSPPHAFSSSKTQPHEIRKIQEMPSDCLVCPNLLNCYEGQNVGADVTRCPLAK